MFRSSSPSRVPQAGFPRIRGDVPPKFSGWKQTEGFSPHTRGCSAHNIVFRVARSVFPAYAGMFRRRGIGDRFFKSFPRIRGDVPRCYWRLVVGSSFSPHTRGCSLLHHAPHNLAVVFPAYAGMFRVCRVYRRALAGFPRIRGDVPVKQHAKDLGNEFSPHTRGCSAKHGTLTKAATVFPAYAGMFRPPGR